MILHNVKLILNVITGYKYRNVHVNKDVLKSLLSYFFQGNNLQLFLFITMCDCNRTIDGKI